MDLPVHENKKLEEGKYTGAIVEILYRTEPYQYMDVYIETRGGTIRIKAGYPTYISESSKLGQLLIRFGAKLIPGQDLDPSKILIGKECTFLVVEQGEYSKVVLESLKPAIEQEKV